MTLIKIILGMFLILWFASTTAQPTTTTQPTHKTVKNVKKRDTHDKEFKNKMDKVVKVLTKEKKILGTTWSNNEFDNSIAYINAGVIDDGTKRDGYAQYLCQTAKEYGVLNRDRYGKRVIVKVNDIKALLNSNRDITLTLLPYLSLLRTPYSLAVWQRYCA